MKNAGSFNLNKTMKLLFNILFLFRNNNLLLINNTFLIPEETNTTLVMLFQKLLENVSRWWSIKVAG